MLTVTACRPRARAARVPGLRDPELPCRPASKQSRNEAALRRRGAVDYLVSVLATSLGNRAISVVPTTPRR